MAAWDPWELFNWGASLGFTVSLLPQLLRTLRLRRADDFSAPFLILVIASAGMMLIYALHISNWAFVIAQIANLLVWSTVLYFRIHPEPRPNGAQV